MINFAEITFKYVFSEELHKYESIIAEAKRHKLTLTDKIMLFVMILNGEVEPCAICGVVIHGKTAIFKFEFVYEKYRNQGILAFMINERLKMCRTPLIERVEVNCMPMSINSHVRAGGKIVKRYKYGGAKVVYENL